VATDHVHLPRVSVREHMLAVLQLLRELGSAEFRVLCHSCRQTIEVVARFLALLELYREGRVTFEQERALGDLVVRWAEPEGDPGAAAISPGGIGAHLFPGDVPGGGPDPTEEYQ
jgi:segregation and condensation protein A